LTYYLDKVEREASEAKNGKPAPALEKKAPAQKAAPKKVEPQKSEPQGNRKEQRKAEAAARQKLKPLKDDLEKLENEISEIETAQKKLSDHLASPEVASDNEKFQETSENLNKLTTKLNDAYSSWDKVTAEIEKLES
jgi:ATP-binding cassette subfamily F protein 3